MNKTFTELYNKVEELRQERKKKREANMPEFLALELFIPSFFPSFLQGLKKDPNYNVSLLKDTVVVSKNNGRNITIYYGQDSGMKSLLFFKDYGKKFYPNRRDEERLIWYVYNILNGKKDLKWDD